MSTETLSGQTQRIDVRVTIHVYSKILAKEDKSLPQDKIDRHFEIVKEVYKRLQGWRKGIDEKTILFNSMQRVSLQNHQYMQGWFVTTQDFVMEAYEIEEKQTIQKPAVNLKLRQYDEHNNRHSNRSVEQLNKENTGNSWEDLKTLVGHGIERNFGTGKQFRGKLGKGVKSPVNLCFHLRGGHNLQAGVLRKGGSGVTPMRNLGKRGTRFWWPRGL